MDGRGIREMLGAVALLVLRSVAAHWRRFALTTVSIVVGVAFVVGSFVLTDSLAGSINKLLSDATAKTDFVVRAGSGRGGIGGGGDFGRGGGGGGRGSVAASLVPVVAAVAGVTVADPSITGPAQLLDKAGDADRFDVAPITNWPDHPDTVALRLTSGRAPTGPDEVVVDAGTAASRSVALGRSVRVGTRRGIVSATVVGLAERGAGNLGAAGALLAFTTDRATELVGTSGQVDSIVVRVDPQLDKDEVRMAIATAVGPDVSVLSADALLADARQRLQDRLANFNRLMLGFAAVTLFVSAFLIWNTFAIVVAQRRRELALLRAVGASSGQVSRSVIGEAVLVGAAASAIGVGLGVLVAIGLRALLSRVAFKLPSSELVLAPRTVVAAFVVGSGITILSVLLPAWRSARIPPVAAMQSASVPPPRAGRVWPIVGVAALLLGLAVGLRSLLSTGLEVSRRVTLVGVAGVLVFLGVAGISRYLAGPVISVMGRVTGRLGGVAGQLARQNAVRDPRRTASTACALMIGLALVATTLVLGESVKTAFGGALRRTITADVVVDAGSIVPFDPTTTSAIAATEGVSSAVPISFARARLAGQARGRVGVSTADITSLAGVVDPDFLMGALPADDTHIALSKSFSDEQKLTVGQTLTIHADNADRALVVSGIYQHDELLDDAVSTPAAIGGLTGVEAVTKLVLVTSDRVDAVIPLLTKATSAVPNSTAQTADDYVTAQTNSFDIVLGIVDVLLMFAVLVAALGVANTLALAVVERTRELGLLRAVGMERRSVRRMIRIEGVLVAMFGGLLGLGVGVAFGAAVAAVLPVDSAQLTFPVARLLLLLVIAGVLGVVASALPARRGARLDVLAAIAE